MTDRHHGRAIIRAGFPSQIKNLKSEIRNLLRVVILSKALVVGAYHSKLKQLAARPDMDLIAVVPPSWRDERGELRLEPTPAEGYQFIVTPIRFNGNFHLHYYPQFDRLLKQLKPDLVHIDEEPYNLATFLAQRSARTVKARTVFFSWQNLNRTYPPPFRWFERYVLKHAAAGIVGNRDSEQVWRAKGYRGPLTIIPQVGVEPDIFKPLDERASGSSDFRRRLCRSLCRREGHRSAIAGVVRPKLVTGAPIWLGSGPDQARLAELAQRLQTGRSGTVSAVDAVHADRQLLSLHRRAGAAFVQPAQLEGTIRARVSRCDGLRGARRRLDLRRDSQRHRRGGLDLSRKVMWRRCGLNYNACMTIRRCGTIWHSADDSACWIISRKRRSRRRRTRCIAAYCVKNNK